VVRGAGGNFSAGADTSDLLEHHEPHTLDEAATIG
jgi:enoyl-CoA hydratase/carnithine racemase